MASRRSLRSAVQALALAALCLGSGRPATRAQTAGSAPAPGSWPLVAILGYHEVSNEPSASPLTVTPEFLRSQIRASKAAGWVFLPLSEIHARFERGEDLPRRTMALTFDDGYRSFIEHALPILREERVPATLAIISSFVDAPPADLAPLLSWAQIAEAEASGLVAIASHSHDLHRWVTNNPYGDTSQSPTTRRYLREANRYEDREEYRQRIAAT